MSMPATKQLYKLSEPLSRMLGKSQLTRPQALKEFWAYAKKHNLQDPNNGRLIIANEEMKQVFNKDRINFTEVMGLISKNLTKTNVQ